jgi:hypothetical protein
MRGGNILKDQLPSGSLATVVPCLILLSMPMLLIQNPKTLSCASFNILHRFPLRLSNIHEQGWNFAGQPKRNAVGLSLFLFLETMCSPALGLNSY